MGIGKKIVILEHSDYGKVFLMSELFGAVEGLVLSLLFKGFDYKDVIIALSIASTGGLSSVICGKLFLPKAKI